MSSCSGSEEIRKSWMCLRKVDVNEDELNVKEEDEEKVEEKEDEGEEKYGEEEEGGV